MVVRLEEISHEEVTAAVKAHFKNEPFTLQEYSIRPASDNPLGFLGDHVRIKAKVIIQGGEKEVHLFGKKIPTKVAAHYEYATKTRAFYKEIELYKTLLDDIQKAISPARQAKKWLPEFYYFRGDDILIIEDLSVHGYYMAPERTVLDLEHVQVAIEAIAAMHAGSFIFEEKLNAGKATTHSKKFVKGKMTTIGELYDNLTFETEASDIKGHPGNTFWEAGFSSQLPVIDLLPDYTPAQRETIKKNIISKLRTALQFVKPSDKFKNVLLHGDLWANNLLFLKDDKGAVSEAVILDFQLGRYGPPAHDILMFLYLVQTREFRTKHQRAILDLYYKKLASELAAEELDATILLPRNKFDESIKYYTEYAILNNIMYFQLMLTPSEISGEFLASPELFHKNMQEDRSEMVVACYKNDEICRSRMTEAVREAAEFYKFKNVLLHGDLWANNLLFLKDDKGTVSEAVILDFQLARYGPPAHDILMFLYLVQTREFRTKHQRAIIDLYYRKLASELAAEGLEVAVLLPRKEFDASIKYYTEYAILNNIMYYQLVLTPSEVSAEFLASPELFHKNMQEDRSAMIVSSYKTDFICRSRMTEAVREAAEFYKWV